jgi:hypothetical protein
MASARHYWPHSWQRGPTIENLRLISIDATSSIAAVSIVSLEIRFLPDSIKVWNVNFADSIKSPAAIGSEVFKNGLQHNAPKRTHNARPLSRLPD